ncbi:hypothetical protein [Actinomyces trachealis]|uniref:hypothetical protein n=1 Tax=Actinomyces trachealis TaxID=2763540 RepID=UPI001892947E|nr:hypothetical protein [Actinomyces trachealis]
MPRDTDSAVLDATRVHRERLLSALERGSMPGRNRKVFPKVLASLVTAALMCAACVGYSFVSTHLPAAKGGMTPNQTTGATTGSAP